MLKSEISNHNSESWKRLDEWIDRNQVTTLEWHQPDGDFAQKYYDSPDNTGTNIKSWCTYFADRMGGAVVLFDRHIEFSGGGKVYAIKDKLNS